MKENRSDLLHTLTERLKAIDYNKLPISDYNKRYIGNLKPALSYFMHIYGLNGVEAVVNSRYMESFIWIKSLKNKDKS